MARVIGIEIHYNISALATMDDEAFFVSELGNTAEGAFDIVTFKRTILAT
jgi:hypothetical protein